MTKKLGLVLLPLSLLALLVANLGCATSFHGNAHFPGGIAACERRCERADMEMAEFVFVGEYSSACVCGSADDSSSPSASAGAGTAAAVAVMTQTRSSQQQRAR